MSMISAQIDELRELAGDVSMEWVAGPIRASVLRDAADTIWQLRDDLQQANAENAKLRGLVRDMFYAVHPADREKFLTNVAELGLEVEKNDVSAGLRVEDAERTQ